MKKILSAILALVVLTVTLFSLSSCGKQDDDGAEISAYLVDEIYGLDPASDYTNDDTQFAMSLLYEPLFTINDRGVFKYAAAKSYKFDRDTGDLYITLRESYWSDGQRVMASDFVYAWRRLLEPSFNSPAATLLFDIKNAVKAKTADGDIKTYDVGINALDTSTIKISFENNNVDRDAFLRNLASIQLSPVRSLGVETSGDYWAKSASTIVCNGAFKVRQLNYTYGYFTLARNEGYHRPEKSTKAVDTYVIPSQIRTLWNTEDMNSTDYLDKMYNYFEQNVVFFMSSFSENLADTVKYKTTDRLSTYTYVFNQKNALFADVRVRKALGGVIDRNKIMELVSIGEVATGLISPSVMDTKRKTSFRDEGGSLIPSNASMTIDAANALLDEALDYGRGEFAITYYEDTVSENIALYLGGLWEQCGFTVNIRPLSKTEVTDNDIEYHEDAIQVAYETGNYDVIAFDYQMMSTSAFGALAAFSTNLSGNGVIIDSINGTTTAVGNFVGYSNSTYDGYIDSALNASNSKDRAAFLHQAEQLLIDEAVVLPLYFNQTAYICSKSLRGITFNYNGFPVFTRAKLRNYDEYFFDDLKSIFFPEEE